jgi:glycosyltransferase involved in cell wall biosynthesis
LFGYRVFFYGGAVIHIVHVETGRHLYGGARQVLMLMHGLIARGHRCTLVCPDDSEISTAARTTGVAVQGVAMGGDLDINFTWRLARLLRQLQPDIVHVHSRRGADTFGGVAACLGRVPAVLSRRIDRDDLAGLGRLKYAPYQRIIAISSCIRDQLAALGVPAAKLRLVRSAVAPVIDIERASGREFSDEFGLSAEAFPIAVVAQLIVRKGHRFFLEAVAQLRDTHPEIRAILFGIGPLQAELAARVTELGLSEQVQFAGYRHDLARFIGRFELLVHPAEREGLGVGVLEAQAAGVPVIGFRAGGLAEAIADGETGLLVSPGNVPALTAAMRQLIEDDSLRRQFAAAGPARIHNDYRVEVMVDGNLAVYGELISE